MHAIQMPYAKRFCKRRKFFGHVWSGRYRSIPHRFGRLSLRLRKLRRDEPVRAGLVAKPEDWPHSSYQVYAFGRPDPLVTVDPFYPGTASTDPNARSITRTGRQDSHDMSLKEAKQDL